MTFVLAKRAKMTSYEKASGDDIPNRMRANPFATPGGWLVNPLMRRWAPPEC